MLPDKNELNNELIERNSGGKDCQEKNGQKEEAALFKGAARHRRCSESKHFIIIRLI